MVGSTDLRVDGALELPVRLPTSIVPDPTVDQHGGSCNAVERQRKKEVNVSRRIKDQSVDRPTNSRQDPDAYDAMPLSPI